MNDNNVNNGVNGNLNSSNKSGDNNPYKDYLPQKRYADEGTGLFSPKLLKKGLFLFYVLLFVAVVGVVLHFNGYDILKTSDRNYNMNLAETIDLDVVYQSDDVEWVSSSDNVVVKNNVATALKPGNAYIYAKKGNQQVTDINLNVLTTNESLNIVNHSINLNMDQRDKIIVNRNILFDEENKSGIVDRIIKFVNDIINNGSNNETSSSDDTNNNDINSDSNNSSNNSDNSNNNVVSDGKKSDVSSVEDDLWEEITDEDEEDFDDSVDNEVIYHDNSSSSEGLKYTSSNEKIAKVDDEGNVEPVSPGVVEITVEDENGNKDHSVVSIKDDSLDFDCEEYKLNVGDVVKIEYQFNSMNYGEEDINWSSSSEDIVVVNDNGEISAVGVGSATITASVGQINKEIEVEVASGDVLPSDIIISTDNVSVYVGESVDINASVSPDNAVDKTLSWSSDNDLIASVGNGTVVGKSVGHTLINVTTVNGVKKSINVNVLKRDIPVESIVLLKNDIVMNVGEVYKLNYNINPSNATNKNVKITYDKNFVSIDDNNNITALKSGVTKVQLVSDNGKSVDLNITINAVNVKIAGLKLIDRELKLVEGSEYTLVASVNPANTTERNISWSSSNNKVATVDNKGNVKAIAVGTATITVTSNDNPKLTDSCTVTVVKNDIEITGITLTKNTVSMYIGDSDKLTATVSPNNVNNSVVKWKSDNDKVVTVDSNGNIKAISEGKATITAYSSSNSKINSTCVVTVSDKKVERIELNKSTTSLSVNDVEQLSVKVIPNDAKDKEVVWSSSNSKVVTVDSNGKIKAIASGDAVVTVKLKSNNKISASCNVKVEMLVKSIVLNKNSLNLKVNETFKLVPTISPSNASDKSVTWKSSNTNVASVDSSGNIKGLASGSATITVTSKAAPTISSSCTVTVSVDATKVEQNVTGITISDKPEKLSYNSTYQLKAVVKPSGKVTNDVIWKSSKPSVVSVDSNGKIKVIMNINNKVTITATYGVYSASVEIITRVKLINLNTDEVTGKGIKISPYDTLFTISSDGDYTIAEGFCVANYNGDTYLYAIRKNSGSDDSSKVKVYVKKRKVDKNGKITFPKVNNFIKTGGHFGHANDMTFNSKTNSIYVVGKGSGNRVLKDFTKTFNSSPDFSKFKLYKGGEKLSDFVAGGIAYDSTLDRFYFSKGGWYKITDSSMNIISNKMKADGEYTKNDEGDYTNTSTAQGIGAYNGKILVIRTNKDLSESDSTVKKPKNAIDVYDGSTGEYIGTNVIKGLHELESVDYYRGNDFVIYSHSSGKVQKIKLNLG